MSLKKNLKFKYTWKCSPPFHMSARFDLIEKNGASLKLIIHICVRENLKLVEIFYNYDYVKTQGKITLYTETKYPY